MIEFDESDFGIQSENQADNIDYLGSYKIPMEVYRNAIGLANSDLQIFDKNPSGYIWNKSSPIDHKRASVADFGTALHTALLEPDLFDDSIMVSSTKGREASSFAKDQARNPDKIVLTDNELKQVQIMADSAKCDPMFDKIMKANGDCEFSIFVDDPLTGLRLKIRVDKVVYGKKPLFCDVKSTANIDDWRNDKQWLNPLFKMNYGFTAAFYLYVGSIFYGIELDKYAFPIVQKTPLLGRYPVSTFIISKNELVEYGFWDQMLSALERFKACIDTDKFACFEYFPTFTIFDNESITISESN